MTNRPPDTAADAARGATMSDEREPRFLIGRQVTIQDGLNRGRSGMVVGAHDHVDGWYYEVNIGPVEQVLVRERDLLPADPQERTS